MTGTPSDPKRLIEVAFPLKQVSLDSVHEKNVRHGHISTLHIWPARRPLAAARAALITTLLPDPGNDAERREILERMAGKVVEKVEKKRVNGRVVEKMKEQTEEGILHWGRESGPDLDWFREKIRKAYGGRAPKVLDPFAGGGAIPLEAMRLGCEVTAMDINPVAWFILKCTLEYPQRLAGQTRPLPAFALEDRDFMESFFKAKGEKGARLRASLERLGHMTKQEGRVAPFLRDDTTIDADLAWHVRAWGRWVLAQARRELASYYPTYAEFTTPEANAGMPVGDAEGPCMRFLEPDEDGVTHVQPLNAEFDDSYLKDPRKPRWIAKPTVAYLWARTVPCKQCRAILPLLKTRWLCKKDTKRVLLTMEPKPDGTGVVFGVQPNVPQNGGNGAQRREHDRRTGAGTMSRTGATCPCCGAIMTMQDVRLEGRAGRLDAVMTTVVVDGLKGKEYRLPTDHEREVAEVSEERLQVLYADIPFGLPEEQTPKAGSGASRAFSVDGYGLDTWRKLFTNRQLVSLGSFLVCSDMNKSREHTTESPTKWSESIPAYLASMLDRLANQNSTICRWNNRGEKIEGTFSRFALPIVWDFAETNPIGSATGGYESALEWVSRVVSHLGIAVKTSPTSNALCQDAQEPPSDKVDIIITDPPYYDAIPYSDSMDFFFVWLKRSVPTLAPHLESEFTNALAPKWNHDTGVGELIDDASRFNGDRLLSKTTYENGMARAFQSCHFVLEPNGRMVIVFANKQPDAWETLAAALIKAGFVVDGSWPIQTEMSTRTRAMSSAALASSVWLVCRKRTAAARPGWDNVMLREMRENVTQKLRDFWDAGIRGPDFVWAATGPALEAFSKYPVVRKANDESGGLMTVSEFLREVRRMVVDFVVGRVLTQDGEETVTGLDDVTTYYLLHRHDFGMEDAPVGGCILYALSCNLSDSALVNQHDLLAQSGSASAVDEPDEDDPPEDAERDDDEEDTGSGGKVRLKPWNRRRGRNLGLEGPGGKPVPLIDHVHKLMHLWKAGDQVRVNEYLDSRGLQRNALFHQILQALIELAPAGTDERSILEVLSNHAAAHGNIRAPSTRQMQLGEVL